MTAASNYEHGSSTPIAIVGLAGRFPGARDVDALWELLIDKRSAIVPVPKERWDASAALDPTRRIQAVGGFLDAVDEFDCTFFGISPREAEDIDPQQRLMLEASYRALEDAGIAPEKLRNTRTGVYVGASWHDYEILRKERGAPATQHSAVGNALDMLATRLSYYYKLKGPSLTIETGCSSSLVALHIACRALASGEIDGAFVGGVNLVLAPDVSIGLTHFGGLSPTGRCQAFSAKADGFVRGEGVVALYVKTLAQALADGDHIHAVIAATAVNNDGGGDSLVTPSPEGQEDLLRRAYTAAQVPLEAIAYVEAHGTGTSRGDPIEAGAIGRVLGKHRHPTAGALAVGSIKTNIGHLEAVAGLAGLVKGVLALEHRLVPANLHGEELNPAIPFDELNLNVVREPLALPESGDLYVGVNSFGWGGTNAHVVLRSAPPMLATTSTEQTPTLVVLSAQNDDALRTRARELAEVIPHSEASVAELAGTLAHRRAQLAQRVGFVVESKEELAEQLAAFLTDPESSASGKARTRGRVAFVFPGQGSQWASMGAELYRTSARFQQVIKRCAAALAPHVSWDLEAFVSGAAGEVWLHGIDTLQPTLWAMSVGLAELWREAGVEPDVVVGHSMGEVAAAAVAGMLSYEDAALVIARRSAMAQSKAGRGQMLAVDLSIEAARAALSGFEDTVSLAVNNGPSSCVLSGDTDSIGVLKEILEADGTFCRLVRVDFASHSQQMDEFKGELFAALDGITPRPGNTSLMSTVEVRELEGLALDASYWVKNLREPVLFAAAMQKAFAEGVTHVIEISPHPVLTPAIEQLAALESEAPSVLSTLRRDEGSPRHFATALARAYAAGLSPFGLLRKDVRVKLPGYPLQQRSFWPAANKRKSSLRVGLEVELAPTAVESDTWEGALELALQELPWLRDHRVHEAVVLPATAMMACAVAAAQARFGTQPEALVDVKFSQNLTLQEEPTALRVLFRDDVAEGGSFSLLSLESAGVAKFGEHASARIERASERDQGAPFPSRLLEAEAISAERFYQACTARGLVYGPAFQGLRQLFTSGREALGEVVLPESCRASLVAGNLHAALWDAALQVSLALCEGGASVVPTAVARVALLGSLAEPVASLWSHVVRNDDAHFDLTFYASDRTPLMHLSGLTLERLVTQEVVRTDEQRVHRLQFKELARSAAPAVESWLVVGSERDGAAELGRALQALGATASRVERGTSSTWAETLRNLDHVRAVAFVAPREASSEAHREALMSLTSLVAACSKRATPPRLAVITTHAQALLDDEPIDASAALYWGFTRVLRREHAELAPLLVDLSADTGSLVSCASELYASDGEDQLALRGERRFVGRLVRGDSTGAATARAAWKLPAQPFRLTAARPGFWDGLEYRPIARSAPSANEVEVEVASAALNFIDVMKAMGTYPGVEGRAALLGGELAGRVVAVGSDVSHLHVGDRVVGCAFGAFASHVTLAAEHVQKTPDWLPDAQAAALPLVMMTAWYGLCDLAQLGHGESVLIHSATGGLGLAAIQVAKLRGAKILATAGSEEKRRYLRELGIEHVFDSRSLAWADEVRNATAGRGVDVVLNSLTGAAIRLGLELLADDGRFIEVGKKDIYGGRSMSLSAFKKGISFAAVDLAGLMERRPQRFAQLFSDVWRALSAEKLKALPVLPFTFARAADALRTMSQGAHIGKFVLSEPSSVREIAPEPLSAGRFREDATYLITGGLGALGLALTEFMSLRGASHFLLLGRSAPQAAAVRQIAALRERGVRIDIAAVDVADEPALKQVLADARRTLPPLRGVIHAAGLLDDATVLNLTREQLTRVLAPKVEGATNLDQLTREDPLDLFVMFSSAAALIGNAGQAAYAAGNAYMDALSEARRRSGLPSLSVHWGPFAEIGLAAEDKSRGARLAERGMGSFSAEEAFCALLDFLGRDVPVLGYVPLSLRQWFDAYPDTAAQKSWQLLRESAQGGEKGSSGNSFVAALTGRAEAERQGFAEAKVRELAGRVLRLDPSAIESDAPFKALGLDSLMSLELRNRLEATFGLRLSPTLLWTYGNSRALAAVLCERALAAQSAPAA